MKPSCVVLGALCEDTVKTHGSIRRGIGGTSYYFSAAFSSLGGRIGCVTKSSDVWMLDKLSDLGIELDGVGPGRSSCFELSYQGWERSLRLLRHSTKIGPTDIPQYMLGFDGLHIGPVEKELDPLIWTSTRENFGFISLDIQGLARIFDPENGKVGIENGLSEEMKQALGVVDVVKFGHEEAEYILGAESSWLDAVAGVQHKGTETVIITLGPRGALLCEGGRSFEIPAYPSHPIDWTGAGDCFMAGFVFQRLKGFDSVKAANFGSALAAIVIEKPRPLRFPEEKDVMAKMRSGFKP